MPALHRLADNDGRTCWCLCSWSRLAHFDVFLCASLRSFRRVHSRGCIPILLVLWWYSSPIPRVLLLVRFVVACVSALFLCWMIVWETLVWAHRLGAIVPAEYYKDRLKVLQEQFKQTKEEDYKVTGEAFVVYTHELYANGQHALPLQYLNAMNSSCFFIFRSSSHGLQLSCLCQTAWWSTIPH